MPNPPPEARPGDERRPPPARRRRLGTVATLVVAAGLFAPACADASAGPDAAPTASSVSAVSRPTTTTTTSTTSTTTAPTTTSTATARTTTTTRTASSPTTGGQASRGVIGMVAVVGDSLSAQSVAQETAHLEAEGWSVVVNAQGGRRVTAGSADEPPYSGTIAVDQVRASGKDPHTWVVELGTNDVGAIGTDATAIRKLIDTMLAKIGPGHEIVWVSVHHGSSLAASAAFNRVLASVASVRSDLVVADWAAIATEPGLLFYDNIHLSDAGEAAFAALIAGAVGAAPT